MKMKWILLVLLFSLGKIGTAQTIPNAGFENLDTTGFPSNWTGDGFGSGTDIQNHSGSRSMAVWNWYYYGKGFAVNGVASSYLWAYEGGTPYTQKATQLNGFYRYDTVDTYSNHDSALVAVLLKKFNTTTQQIDTIGYGITHLPAHAPTDGTFAPFSVNIADWDPSEQPDSIVVLLVSSLNGFCENADDGYCLYFNVDDLSLVTPMGVTDVGGNILETGLYPNPSDGNSILMIAAENNGTADITIADITGKIRDEKSIPISAGKNRYAMDFSNLDSGIYFISIASDGNMNTIRMIKI